MFQLFKKKSHALTAPVDGKLVPLESVPDMTFASRLIGDGIAVKPESDIFCAPCDGTLTMVFETLHAFGIKAENGAELLIHIGFETVNLAGEGFTKLAEEGKKVKAGQPIIQIDRRAMEERKIDLTTPMIITNKEEHPFNILKTEGSVKQGVDLVIAFR